jgi:triacylglycerol esterase/lipase EstA (alpha/beta hydrolase family)
MIIALVFGTVVFGGTAAYIAWAAYAVWHGASVWHYAAGGLALVIGIPGAFAAFYSALAWVYRSERPPAARIGAWASLRLLWDESRALGRSGPRQALYRRLMDDPAPAPAELPVLLVHGVLCNAGVWLGLRRHLLQQGIGPVYALTYGPPLASIEFFAEQVAAKIGAVLAVTGARQVAIVGHSMGGLVARAYLRRYGASKVRVLITLATPHHGSVHAWLFPGTCLAQIRPGSEWLAELNRDEGSPPPTRIVSLWSWHDSMVAPQTSARLAGIENIEVVGVGHNAMLGDSATFERVATELRRAAGNAEPGGAVAATARGGAQRVAAD